MIPNDILCCAHRSLPYPVIISLPLAADGNRCRDPQRSIKQNSVNPAKEEEEKLQGPEGSKYPRGHGPQNQLNRGHRAHGDWNTEGAIMESVLLCARSYAYMLWFGNMMFCGTPKRGSSRCLWLLLFLGTFLSYWIALSSFNVRVSA